MTPVINGPVIDHALLPLLGEGGGEKDEKGDARAHNQTNHFATGNPRRGAVQRESRVRSAERALCGHAPLEREGLKEPLDRTERQQNPQKMPDVFFYFRRTKALS
ncbi:MAG: hypothetical protein ACJAVK_003702 [Akkermansiaceae bacterium]